MADLPYVEVHAPNVRFTERQMRSLAGSTGVVSVVGLSVGDDGTYGAVRITFADNVAMGKYCYAYRAMRTTKEPL